MKNNFSTIISISKQAILLGLLLFYLYIIGTYFINKIQEGMDDTSTQTIPTQTIPTQTMPTANSSTNIDDDDEDMD